MLATVPGYQNLGPIAAVTVSQRIAATEAADAPPEQRAWRLWLEAQQAKNAGAFALAHEALDAADRVAGQVSPLRQPVLLLEIAGLRGKLFQDDGEPGRAHSPLTWAVQRWLTLGAAIAAPTSSTATLVSSAYRGVGDMVFAAVGKDYVASLAAQAGIPAEMGAVTLWFDRLVTEAKEIITRAISSVARVDGFAAARGLANDALAKARSWSIPGWDPLRFEVGIRLTLSSAADGARLFAASLGQSSDGLALAERLLPGNERDTLVGQMHANHARALLGLGRAAEAADEYEVALERLRAAGAYAEAAVIALAPGLARVAAGEPMDTAELIHAITMLEAQVTLAPGGDGRLMAMLEYARRFYLFQLARDGGADLETVIGLIEVLRGDRPLLRQATGDADPVVARVTRPFVILGERLRKLPDTVLVAIEPQIEGPGHTPVFLVIAGGGWHLATSDSAHSALYTLVTRADDERQALLTGERMPRSAPSARLVEAAETGWRSLPASVRAAIRAARTVIYLPSSGASVADIPFELLRHEGGWLGTTHVVARCPSFQYLEEALAPNARRPRPDPRLVIARLVPDQALGLLGEAEAETVLVSRAAPLLGLAPEPVALVDPATALTVFTTQAPVHYVGHGFANPIGELLPLAADAVLNASELPDGDGAPFVFFNACLLGRVRHVAGGRQRGWALRLLDRGAPAVVGALATVPDSVCVPVARAFYTAARNAAVGEAMREARAKLDASGMHPLVWAAYVVHGDPFAGISASVGGSAAALVGGWPDATTRALAVGSALSADDLSAAVGDLLDRDPEGAAVQRIQLALARLARNPDDQAELNVAYLCADSLRDGYAILYLYAHHAKTFLRDRPAGTEEVFRNSARSWLASLEGDGEALAPLAARLPF